MAEASLLIRVFCLNGRREQAGLLKAKASPEGWCHTVSRKRFIMTAQQGLSLFIIGTTLCYQKEIYKAIQLDLGKPRPTSPLG